MYKCIYHYLLKVWTSRVHLIETLFAFFKIWISYMFLFSGVFWCQFGICFTNRGINVLDTLEGINILGFLKWPYILLRRAVSLQIYQHKWWLPNLVWWFNFQTLQVLFDGILGHVYTSIMWSLLNYIRNLNFVTRRQNFMNNITLCDLIYVAEIQ